jgi:thiol-disulfide isomerase/thioredoxin
MRSRIFLVSAVLLMFSCSCLAMAEKPSQTGGEKSAADFTLKSLDGKTVRLSDYRGKVVFVNFWSMTCPPCRMEMPSMEDLYKKLRGNKFEMLAVNLDQDREEVKTFIKENKYTFPVLIGDEDVAMKYYVSAIPVTYIIDKKGKILLRHVGAAEWGSDRLVKEIRKFF